MESLISLNILKNTLKNGEVITYELINPKPEPILFYSTKDITFEEELIGNEDLLEVLRNIGAFTYLTYSNTSINGIKYILDKQEYENVSLNVQDIYPLDSIEEGRYMCGKMIEYILMPMYNKCQGDPTILTDDAYNNVKAIYNHIKKVYPSEFDVNDIANFLKENLIKRAHLNQKNSEYIYNIFFEIVE